MATTHLEKTSDNSRNEVISQATVIGMRDESKTVKFLTLSVNDHNLYFKAGQWVDMFIPGVDTVGGFSMCSSPDLLESTHSMELAVKYSKHPPAYWIHTQCTVGSQVSLRVGGDFFYDDANHGELDLLLIAGGVGINPLLSIINHVTCLHNKGGDPDRASKTTRVMLLYSARNIEELIFKKSLDEISSLDSLVKCQYFVTREENITSGGNISDKRISSQDISSCFDWLRKDKTQVFICGPSPMIQDSEKMLLSIGLGLDRIMYEKWW